ncbi:MAG: hypothetical protein E6J89_00095 [Deltaproteobacteria bacterium]|nr:MAG: hypothetical protein E6J89_00095 [Deltaproteobacteria bacterium]
MTEPQGSAVLRIELWHGVLVLAMLTLLVPVGILEPKALLLGGLFMGVNFLLLSCGIRWLLTPLAVKGRIWAGVFFLLLKFVLFLGLVLALLLRVRLDAPSFAVGVTCLLVAIVMDRLWAYRWIGE